MKTDVMSRDCKPKRHCANTEPLNETAAAPKHLRHATNFPVAKGVKTRVGKDRRLIRCRTLGVCDLAVRMR